LQPHRVFPRHQREDTRDGPPPRGRRRRAILGRLPAAFYQHPVDPKMGGAGPLLFPQEIDLVFAWSGNREIVLCKERSFLLLRNVPLSLCRFARDIATFEATGLAQGRPNRSGHPCLMEHRLDTSPFRALDVGRPQQVSAHLLPLLCSQFCVLRPPNAAVVPPFFAPPPRRMRPMSRRLASIFSS